MTDEKLTPERAVRLLHARAAELEHWFAAHADDPKVPVAVLTLAPDIALVATLLADHIEDLIDGGDLSVEIGDPLFNEDGTPWRKPEGYLSSILEVTEFDVGSKEEADYVAALKAECDAYLGRRQT